MKRKGFSKLILVIIIAAVVVIAGGIFWYYRHSAQKSSSSKTPTVTTDVSSLSNAVCTSPPVDAAPVDVFDSHVHIMSKFSISQIISEMDQAGVSMANLYPIERDDDSDSLKAISQYPGRFITFVDTPDSPEPATWFKQGQAFVTFAESQLKTGKFSGIGETNLRYWSGPITDVAATVEYVPADSPTWLQLVDLSAKYHVPISFHFVPDDAVANVAFEKMLNHNKDAILIWAHLEFSGAMPLDSAALNDYLLRYPNLYFDTGGIQSMQGPLAGSISNWQRLANESDNGRLNEEWRQFFETWNSRILFGSDAGGGPDGLQRWQNYAGNTVKGAMPNAIGHWRGLLSNLDSNAAKNILSANAREMFLKEKRVAFNYALTSNGKCYPISISSSSSVSAPTFDSSTHAISFTLADSTGTTGSAAIIVPTTLVGKNFTVSVDGQSVKPKSTSNSIDTTINLEYTGGIKSIVLSGSVTP